jgi:transcriptional regulator with XRE-family HTH domain
MTETLGQTIRRLRLKNDMSIRALAQQIQTSPAYLSLLELDQQIPTWGRLVSISNALSQDIDSLLIKLFPQDVVDFVKKYPEMYKSFAREFKKTKNFKEIKSLPPKQLYTFNCIVEIDKKEIPITKRSIAEHLGISVYETNYVISSLLRRNLIQTDKKIFSEKDHYGNTRKGQWLKTYIITK